MGKGMSEGWRELAALTEGFYEEVREALVTGRALDPTGEEALRATVGGMLGLSARIRALGESVLAEPDAASAEETAELLLAAACVDALLARDLAVLSDGVSGPAEEQTSLPNLSAEGRALLAEVDAAFEAIAGASGASPATPDREAVLDDSERAIASLLGSALSPASELLTLLLELCAEGEPSVAAAVRTRPQIERLDSSRGDLRAHALGFLREHALKVAALLPDGWPLEDVAKGVQAGAQASALLEEASATVLASERVRIWIEDAPIITSAAAEGLREDLVALENGYAREMLWLAKSTPWLRRGAPALTRLATDALGDPGKGTVPAVLALGLGYAAYSLADRLDARRLPRDLVRGVVPLVELHLAY